MPSYYFHVRAVDNVPRFVEQCDVPGLREALALANSTARALIHNRVGRTHDEIRGSLDIEDAEHRTVARVMFADLARRLS